MMGANSNIGVHPTIKKCLKHLDVLHVDNKTKQIVCMYMESLYKELTDKQKLETKANM
ncbi:hypothetical protein SM124_00210 [Bacillus sp. 31A1R]|uniref:Uncharacterized protein n=1 Tax=Robertmurraya mangrovi TaxID=3098077 RepID=A0ABU5ISP3_9BACI|nr:hypothetical protein [Bacillus sp. 31A1R]MDZ5470157.1 hypothetical protein [Bacillus sp. 31A1R]